MGKSGRHKFRGAPQVYANRPRPKVQTTLYELDRFSNLDVDRWNAASEDLEQLQRELHFGLESQRRIHRDSLLDALRASPAEPIEFDQWVRIVNYQYCLDPLNCTGSFRTGGRFNAGQDLEGAGITPWSALYIAQDQATAYREKFSLPQDTDFEGLTPEELALTSGANFTTLQLRGHIESVFDVGDVEALVGVSSIFAKFKRPPGLKPLERKLRLPPVTLIRSPALLQEWLVQQNWRPLPMQFDLPSHSQVFAELVKAAGYEAISYPSSKTGRRCLAVFPRNLAGSNSFVEINGAAPTELRNRRLDATTIDALAGDARY